MTSDGFDDLARALARPMRRRQAVRLLATSLMALAIPGMRAPAALTRPRAECDYGCGSDIRGCPRLVQGAPGPPLCCGSPARRYRCDGTWFDPVCIDTCDGPGDDPCKGPKLGDGCSEFRCCKKPHKCMNGACSESCKVETGVGTGNTLEYDPKTQCCTPFGPRSKKEGRARECRETRKPRPGYKPTSNGCGTKDDKFPDKFELSATVGNKTRKGTVSFEKACNKHDICYGTCNKDKQECDKAFCDRLKSACESTFPISKKSSKRANEVNRELRKECAAKANLYCVGPQLAGDSAYWNAQSEACLCC